MEDTYRSSDSCISRDSIFDKASQMSNRIIGPWLFVIRGPALAKIESRHSDSSDSGTSSTASSLCTRDAFSLRLFSTSFAHQGGDEYGGTNTRDHCRVQSFKRETTSVTCCLRTVQIEEAKGERDCLIDSCDNSLSAMERSVEWLHSQCWLGSSQCNGIGPVCSSCRQAGSRMFIQTHLLSGTLTGYEACSWGRHPETGGSPWPQHINVSVISVLANSVHVSWPREEKSNRVYTATMSDN